jgi:uncharacterized protein (DUF983 family)
MNQEVLAMQARANVSVLKGTLHQLCPSCRSATIFRASIFRSLPAMRESCPACGLKFEREEGYFLGAMIIDYGLALVIVSALAGIVWVFTRWGLIKSVIIAFVLFLPTIPSLTRFGRVLWIYLDRSIDPEEG